MIKFTTVDSIYVAKKIPKDWPQGKSELCFLETPTTQHNWGRGLYHEHLPIIGQNISRDFLQNCYLPMASLLSCGILRVKELLFGEKTESESEHKWGSQATKELARSQVKFNSLS